MFTREQLDQMFTYHPPTQTQIPRYQKIRTAGREFAQAVADCCPVGADQAAAIRKIREAVMTANAGIATEGTLEDRPVGAGRSKPLLSESHPETPPQPC
jgi:hypothetical protein